MTTLLVTLVFSGGMPLLYPMAAIACLFFYMVEKWLVLRFFTVEYFDDTVSNLCVKLLPTALFLHLCCSIWMFTVPDELTLSWFTEDTTKSYTSKKSAAKTINMSVYRVMTWETILPVIMVVGMLTFYVFFRKVLVALEGCYNWGGKWMGMFGRTNCAVKMFGEQVWQDFIDERGAYMCVAGYTETFTQQVDANTEEDLTESDRKSGFFVISENLGEESDGDQGDESDYDSGDEGAGNTKQAEGFLLKCRCPDDGNVVAYSTVSDKTHGALKRTWQTMRTLPSYKMMRNREYAHAMLASMDAEAREKEAFLHLYTCRSKLTRLLIKPKEPKVKPIDAAATSEVTASDGVDVVAVGADEGTDVVAGSGDSDGSGASDSGTKSGERGGDDDGSGDGSGTAIDSAVLSPTTTTLPQLPAADNLGLGDDDLGDGSADIGDGDARASGTEPHPFTKFDV